MPEIEIKTSKGNIPIDNKLYKKYSTAREIFDNESSNFNGNVKIVTDISEILNKYDISNIEQVKKCAREIFNTYHDIKVFYNNGNKILVSKDGLEESVEKIFHNRIQRDLLYEHLLIFTRLGFIIEHATLINQVPEVKKRDNINYWNYFFDGLNINGIKYSIEFEVRSMDDGENHYRVQRIEIKNKEK